MNQAEVLCHSSGPRRRTIGYFATAIQEKENRLEHHGVLGQKWGIRRYQNKDGSLTAEGKQRVYAQGAGGGYESFRHRNRRAIDAAKYENDIKRNQKKLDRAYEKGNDKKIAKYTQIDKVLKNNRDIMVKDLSPEAIQMGRDYITQMKAGMIGTLIAGPIGGAAAGMGVRYANKMPETEKKVYAQEAERKKKWDETENLKKEAKNYDKTHIDEWDESESDKKWNAYYDSHFDRSEDTRRKYESSAQTQKRINGKVENARKTGMYDMEFLERNLDVDDETGKQLTGKALDKAYKKFIQDEENKEYHYQEKVKIHK